MNTGQSIRFIRKQVSKINQKKFSEKIGISQTYLSQIENGKKTPTLSVLETISEYTNVPIQIFFWFTLTIEDVPEEKREAFKLIHPSIDALIKSIFTI